MGVVGGAATDRSATKWLRAAHRSLWPSDTTSAQFACRGCGASRLLGSSCKIDGVHCCELTGRPQAAVQRLWFILQDLQLCYALCTVTPPVATYIGHALHRRWLLFALADASLELLGAAAGCGAYARAGGRVALASRRWQARRRSMLQAPRSLTPTVPRARPGRRCAGHRPGEGRPTYGGPRAMVGVAAVAAGLRRKSWLCNYITSLGINLPTSTPPTQGVRRRRRRRR